METSARGAKRKKVTTSKRGGSRERDKLALRGAPSGGLALRLNPSLCAYASDTKYNMIQLLARQLVKEESEMKKKPNIE